jgi:hypothetical protein
MASVPGPRRAQYHQRVVDGSIVETPGGTLSYDVLPKGREAAESVIFKVCFAFPRGQRGTNLSEIGDRV